MEIELKLLINSQDAKALRQHPLLKKYALSKPYEQMMSDTYFDTPDLQIRRADAGLRVRRVNNNWVQTLKGGGGVEGGLHRRHEWESQVAGPVPDFAALRHSVKHNTAWGRLLHSPAIEARLLPIFTTQVKRRVWALRLPQGDEVECVLDLGNIEYDGQKAPISEIELELKSGDPMHLFDFALALLQDIPMQIGTLSKADRGYGLYAPLPFVAVKATQLQLSTRMNIKQSFEAIAGNCMTQIQVNAAIVAQEYDPESLHQMRVGLRRLQCLLQLFKFMLQPPDDLLRELDWLATQLGAARDWDVLTGSTIPAITGAVQGETGPGEVIHAALRKTLESHKAAASAVSSPRYTRLMLCFTRWVLGGGWNDAMSQKDQKRLTAPVTKFALNVMTHVQRRLLKRGRKLRGAKPKVRHRVRIAAKNTRYATEFFQSLFVSKKLRTFVDALSSLQDELGRLNDAAIADHLLSILQAEQPRLRGSVGYVLDYLKSRDKNDDKKLRMLWKTFVPMKPFR